jgi:hypothetical protein
MNTETGGSNSAQWIDDGEKYALVRLSVKIEEPVPFQMLVPGFWVMGDARFAVPAHWREWLGTIRANEVADCNLFLVSKLHSQAPDALDDENQALKQRAWHWSSFAPPTCRMPFGQSQASPELIPEEGSPPGFDIA